MNTPRRQHGSMALTMGLLLVGLLSILVLVQVGYLYWAKRDAQKVADLAALSGAQSLPTCTDAIAGAHTNANINKPAQPQFATHIECGTWEPATAGSTLANATSSGIAPATTSANAVKVRVTARTQGLIPSLDFGIHPQAVAVAASQPPVAAFSVGSQLLELHEDGIVPGLLAVLGIDVDGTTALGYKGLAGLRITPAGLLRALCDSGGPCIDVKTITDIGSLNSVLAAENIQVGALIKATATLASQQQLADATVNALNTLAVHAEQQSLGPVQLGTADSTGSPRGLFAYINTTTVQSALDAKVSALDILNISLQAANSRHLIDLEDTNLPGVNLLGGVKVWATVIEPPSIAIGGPGTKAYTAQIRIGLRITTDAIPALGPVLGLLGTHIDIPVVIDVVNGDGVLQGKGPDGTDICGHDSDGSYASILTTSRLLNVCITDFDPEDLGSTSRQCQDNLKKATLAKALGVPVIRGASHIWGVTGSENLDLHVDETKSTHVDLDLGDTVDNIVKSVLQLLAGQEVSNSSDTQHDNQSVDTTAMALALWSGQSISHTNCASLGDGRSDSSERLKCRDAVLQTIQDNARLEPGTAGLLPGVVNLVDSLVGSIGGLLNDVTGALFGTGCGAGLLSGGKASSCINDISNMLASSQASAGGGTSNALLALLGPVLNVLKPVLDGVGTQLLEPLVKILIGDDIGRTDVHLMSLQCKGAQLVY